MSYIVIKGIKRMISSYRYHITDVTKWSVSARGPKGHRNTTIVVSMDGTTIKWRIGYLSPVTYDICDPKSLNDLEDQIRMHAAWRRDWNT
jgi:hypothetical protein